MFMVSAVLNASLYGVYLVIFGISTHILFKRGKALHKYSLFASAMIFAGASLNLMFATSYDISRLGGDSDLSLDLSLIPGFACSWVADIILLWRCYIVWGKKWKVVFLPFLFYIGFHVVVLGARSLYVSFTVGIGGIALNNLFISCLIAFKIFSISRQVTQYIEDSPRNMHRTIIAATLESGVIYSAFLITIVALEADSYRAYGSSESDYSDSAFEQYIRDGDIQEILFRAWPSIAGITTSLVIVRVSLGIAFNDLKTEIMTGRGLETVQQGDGSSAANRVQETEGRKEHTSNVVIMIGRESSRS